MNITDFFLKYNKKYLDQDGAFQNQCTDVAKAYCVEVLGLPPIMGNAIDYAGPRAGFTWIPKTLFNRPNPGDILVWNIGEFGHTAICNWSRFFDVGIFEQNFPIGSPCHYRDTNYKNVLGWLRPQKALEWPVAFIGLDTTPEAEFVQKVMEYTSGKIKPQITRINAQISTSSGMPPYDSCVPFLDTLNLSRVRSAFIFYPPNPTASHEVAHLYPAKNLTFATLTHPNYGTIPVHAFLHLLRKWINHNKLAYIEDREFYPTNWSNAGDYNEQGWRFLEQYQEIVKALKL